MLGSLYPMAERVGLQLLLEPQTSGVIFKAACTSVGVVYPAYQSFKAIEDKKDNKKDEQWLTYWAIYGLLGLMESAASENLAKLPYYYHAKFALLVWLQLPQTQGARMLYLRYLRPSLLKYQPKLDVCLDKLGQWLVMFYSIYKLPVNAAAASIAYGSAQVMAFIRWFTDSSGGSTNASGSTPPVTRNPQSQFILQ